MKTLLKILILILLVSCKEKPNYNPFDDQFNVSYKELKKDKCDSINKSCGYNLMVQKKEKLKVYYQFLGFGKYRKIVAKGFGYEIDTFKINYKKTDNKTRDSILKLPINKNKISVELKRFNYEILNRKNDKLTIINRKKNDTITLKIETDNDKNNQIFYRFISYIKVNPRNKYLLR